jgi:Ni,Fe-hydrogenase III small subunit/ferredoxin
MIRTLLHVLKSPVATTRELLPELPGQARGLPLATGQPCAAGDGCAGCLDACPTAAITVTPGADGAVVALDRGLCLACGLCTQVCPTGTIAEDRRTTVAVRQRAALVQSNRPAPLALAPPPAPRLLRRSLHIREVSTGDSATDMEVATTCNPIFDAGRFGVHFVASPRHADALLVTGPVGRAMQEPLRRCYEAMAEPRLVIAVGAAAVSGGVHRGGYAGANGADSVVPVDVYVPGAPPHPWMIIHGIMLAMGRRA